MKVAVPQPIISQYFPFKGLCNDTTRIRRVKEIENVVRQNDKGLEFQGVLIMRESESLSNFSRSDSKLLYQRLQGRTRNTGLKFLDCKKMWTFSPRLPFRPSLSSIPICEAFSRTAST